MEEPLEDTSIEPHRLFGRPILNVLRDKLGNLRLRRTVQPVVVVGRNLTTGTQTLDDIIDALGRLRVMSGSPRLYDSGALTGNSITTGVGPVTGKQWDVALVLVLADCDATVAARSLAITTDLPAAFTGPTALGLSSSVALTASESGLQWAIFNRGGTGAIVQGNDNGVLASSMVAFPNPIVNPMLIDIVFTNGVAGDVKRLIVAYTETDITATTTTNGLGGNPS